MRLTPEQFQTIYSIFIGIILLFFAFVGIQILMIRHRQNNPPPRSPRRPGKGGTGDYRGESTHATFGTSGIGAGDMSPAGMTSTSGDPSSSGDMASASWDSSSDSGGGDYGGGDYSGGGGDSGGGGSSGSWS